MALHVAGEEKRCKIRHDGDIDRSHHCSDNRYTRARSRHFPSLGLLSTMETSIARLRLSKGRIRFVPSQHDLQQLPNYVLDIALIQSRIKSG